MERKRMSRFAGEGIDMLRKFGAALLLALLLLTARQTARAQTAASDPAALADRFINLEIEETARYQPIKDLVEIDPEIGFATLRDNWTKIRSTQAKESLINTFLCAANPHMVEIIHLGATDTNVSVQSFAIQAAETIAFRPLAENYNVYLEWHKSVEGKTLQEVLIPGVNEFVAKFRAADSAGREPLLETLLTKQFNQPTRISRLRRKAVVDAGILEPLAKCLDPKAGQVTNQYALQVLARIKPTGDFAKSAILPLAGKDSPLNLRYQALQILGSPENGWAAQPLLNMLIDEYPDNITYSIGTALGAIGDPHVLPTLIGMLDADNTREGVLAIGNVLFAVTGVYVKETNDAAWWRQWLDKNKMRLPADLRAAAIPKVALKKRVPDFNQENIPATRPELRHANADPHSAYWLIVPNAQGGVRILRNGQNIGVNPNGFLINNAGANTGRMGLLVVLSGGDGNGANALTFWRDVSQNVFKGRYLIALPVAPRWNAEQKPVWITADTKKEVKEAKFTTESFVADIVKDVASAYPFDTARTFLHGAADSGTAVYASSLAPETPYKGFYLLSAPFKSAALPSLKTAKGRKYFLQQNKEDKASPFLMAAAAQKLLTDSGAIVKLSPYQGKAGYEFAEGREKAMNEALTWLETGK